MRRVVDIDETETHAVARAPLEIVEQGPNEVAADIRAIGSGLMHGLYIAPEVVDARRVGDVAGHIWLIVPAEAVLQHVDRQTIARADLKKRVVKCLWMDRPLDGCVR